MDLNLYKAATEGDLTLLQNLTSEQNSNLPSQLAPNGNTLLHVATDFSQLKFAKALVHVCPALLWQKNCSGNTPLHVATREADLEDFVNFFLDCVVDVENNGGHQEMLRMTNNEGDTALHCAARLGNDNVIKKLVVVDPEVCSILNNGGESLLYLAVASGYLDVPLIIIESAPSWASYKGPGGQTALHMTLFFDEYPIETMKLLADWKCEMLKERDRLGWTPLHYASLYDNVEAIRLFLLLDSNIIYILDDKGESALHIAAFKGHIEAMKEIINHCPHSCYLNDNKGRTPLHAAVLGNRRKVISFILQNPFYLRLMNKPDKDGNMPLHLATHFKLYSAIEILAKHLDVDSFITNKELLTPLDVYEKYHKEGLRAAIIGNRLQDGRGTMTMQHLAEKNIKVMNREMSIETSSTEIESTNNEGSSKFIKQSALEVNLLVATLVATVTFAAGFTMPGGTFEDKGLNSGKAILSTKAAFQVFVVFDIVAFCCSVFAVLLQFHTSLTNHNLRIRYMGIAAFFTIIALFAMILAFASGIHAVLTKSMGFSITPFIICACFVFFYFALLFCDPGFKGFRKLRKPRGFVRDIIVRYISLRVANTVPRRLAVEKIHHISAKTRQSL